MSDFEKIVERLKRGRKACIEVQEEKYMDVLRSELAKSFPGKVIRIDTKPDQGGVIQAYVSLVSSS